MEKRNLKGIEIPPCMVGTWAWGTGLNGSKMIFGKKYDVKQLTDTFNCAYDLGFTLWDTAEVYGMGASEELLGKCIKGRDKVLISTKHMPGKWFKEGSMRKSLHGSCSRLGINQPDIYWLHLPNNLEKNIAAAIVLLKEGKIKNLGLSNYRLSEIKKADKMLREKGFRVAAIQNHFSLLCKDKMQFDIIDWCNENDAVYFSYMVLEQGALTGRYNSKHGYSGINLRRLTFSRRKFAKIEPLLQYAAELSEKYHTQRSQIPIIWAICRGTVPIIGMTKPEYAVQLAQAVTIKLEESEPKELERLADASGIHAKGVWEP